MRNYQDELDFARIELAFAGEASESWFSAFILLLAILEFAI